MTTEYKQYGPVMREMDAAVARAVQDREQEMLRELLQALNQFDGAQSESPAYLWYRALADVRRMVSNGVNR